MKKHSILLIISAAALAFSCSKEFADPTGKDRGETVNQTFSASQEEFIDNDTKASFNNGICWQVNDEIAVSDGKTQSIFVATAVDASGKATFSLKAGQTALATSGVSYKAWYPASIAPDRNGVMSRPQLETNTDGETPGIYTANPMYAESTTFKLSFKNLCALLKLVYTGDDIPVHRQLFESYTEPLWGPYTIVDNTMVPSGTGTSNGRTELRNTNPKYNTYYYAIPAGTYNTLALIAIDNENRCQLSGPMEGRTLTFERNKVYRINIALNDLRTDLSREITTANCYHFAGGGKFMFRATRGNEKAVISGIDYVSVLWKAQAYDTADLKGKVVDEKTLVYRNGYVLFDGNGSQANAVIAAYDKNDKILWSWHIWSLNSARPVTSVTVNGLTMLDRNLGAYYADKYSEGGCTTSVWTAGCLYQWGRKDPFPGRGQEGAVRTMIKMMDKYNNVLGKVNADGVMIAPPALDGPVTVAESVANPEKYIKEPSEGHWASDNKDTWGGDKKTIYDPCPYGYRVPAKADFSAGWKAANFTECVAKNYPKQEQSYHGFYYSDGTNRTFFPISGQINWTASALYGAYLGESSDASTATAEAYGRLWTRNTNESTGRSIIQVRGYISAGNTWEKRGNNFSIFENKKAYGLAVRCVKE